MKYYRNNLDDDICKTFKFYIYVSESNLAYFSVKIAHRLLFIFSEIIATIANVQTFASLENTLRSQGNLERETLELVTCLQDALSASNTSFAAAGLLQTLESGQLKAHLKIAEDNARQAFEALDKTSADQPFAEEKFTPPKSCSRARASTTAGTAFAGRGGRCSPARLWRGRT